MPLYEHSGTVQYTHSLPIFFKKPYKDGYIIFLDNGFGRQRFSKGVYYLPRSIITWDFLLDGVKGVYIIEDSNGYIRYVGISDNLQRRLKCHRRKKYNKENDLSKWKVYVTFIDNKVDREFIETYLINRLKPIDNKNKKISGRLSSLLTLSLPKFYCKNGL